MTSLIAAINAERAKQRLAPLRRDDGLQKIAEAWAAQMAHEGRMYHGDFSGRITSVHPNVAGAENVAGGQRTVEEVVKDWMNSPGHRRNILGPYNAIGAGQASENGGWIYWCLDFAAL